MRPRSVLTLARLVTLLGAVAALVVVAALGISAAPRPAPRAPEAAAPRAVSPAGATPVRPGRPVAVRLPSVGVRAAVVPVGLEPDGTLVPPADPGVVGWWTGGSRPGGSHGAAVLTGHTVHDGGGAFDDLAALEVGDPVEVVAGERVLELEVSAVRDVSRAGLAARAGRLFSPSGAPRLVLVTCSGWDGEGYRGNTVVVARGR